ncbi:Hsp20/alpha crystallin family protein [Bacillus sp. HMF5848]|nr:Hsp20/alpha crystallin family protein [Bacillus sp. HMF5848]
MQNLRNVETWKDQWGDMLGEDFWGNFEPLFQESHTQYNLYKKENELLVVVSIPGLTKLEDLDVYIDYKTIELTGHINLKFKGFEIVDENIYQGKFQKSLNLPFPVRDDKVDADYHNGLLYIHLHRLIKDDIRKKIHVKKMSD